MKRTRLSDRVSLADAHRTLASMSDAEWALADVRVNQAGEYVGVYCHVHGVSAKLATLYSAPGSAKVLMAVRRVEMARA